MITEQPRVYIQTRHFSRVWLLRIYILYLMHIYIYILYRIHIYIYISYLIHIFIILYLIHTHLYIYIISDTYIYYIISDTYTYIYIYIYIISDTYIYILYMRNSIYELQSTAFPTTSSSQNSIRPSGRRRTGAWISRSFTQGDCLVTMGDLQGDPGASWIQNHRETHRKPL